MAKNKTAETKESVTEYINAIGDETKRSDAHQLTKLMTKITGFKPKMWGPSIIGFGKYHYVYESGHEGDAPLTAFSPRKSAIVIYLSSDFENRNTLLKKLGKHKTGKVCLYIKKLQDIDMAILQEMIINCYNQTRERYVKK